MEEVIIPDKDKVYRCDHCKGVLHLGHINEGGCPKCGGRRVQIAVFVTDDEMDFLKREGYEFKPEYWMDEAQAIEKRRLEREIHI